MGGKVSSLSKKPDEALKVAKEMCEIDRVQA